MIKKGQYHCSFCGKSQDEAKLIITGPAPHDICDECVDRCVEVLYEQGHSLPSVNSKLGRKYIDLSAELGIKPRFNKVVFERIDDQCFYLCPFRDPFDTIYRDHVVPTITSLGLTVKRADDIYSTQPIIDDIWEGINSSEVILADVTGRNPNVMYEVGLAHTVGKPVIIVTQTMDDVPFDLKHYRCIVYSYTPPGVKELQDRLYGTLAFLKHGQKKG